MRLIENAWRGDSARDSIVRAVLAPLEIAYRGIVATRNSLYDRGMLGVEQSPIPTLSVGNVTVGGTGKTPVAAWIAQRLKERGKAPAIVMRGYGDDEPAVHTRLNPDVPVIVNPDRVAGIASAAARGIDVAILDDGFQHRRAKRSADIVLISADDWTGRTDLLPAGPFRESLSSLSRASLVLITRKTATASIVSDVETAVGRAAPGIPIATAALSITSVIDVTEPHESLPVDFLAQKRVIAIAAVGNPEAFFAQLRAVGAVVSANRFPDHHAFTEGDARELARRAETADYVVCTLKDAVKLERLWPAGSRRLWYVSLAVQIERGSAAMDDLLSRF